MSDLDDTVSKVMVYATLNIHKSKPAKLLIPFLRIPILISSTSWDHFFNLRCADSADADLREQSMSAHELYLESEPRQLAPYEWHVPFNSNQLGLTEQKALKVAAANIARLSYTNFDKKFNLESNLKLADSLVKNLHMSPFEHIAYAEDYSVKCRNYTGFVHYRSVLEGEHTPSFEIKG